MATTNLEAVVIGAGWAGEGHTRALHHAGVHVHTICARQIDIVRAVAERLEVPNASVDWRTTLSTVKPDIVALATPASLRQPVIEVATSLGCHVLCEKPLAINARDARELLDLVEGAAVRHAYAATGGYHPNVAWVAELLADGAIGEVREVDSLCRYGMFGIATTPFSWFDTLAAGGGYLNNGLPHCLAIAERVAGGVTTRVMGAATTDRRQAPVIPGVHDFRELWSKRPADEALRHAEWRKCDADTAATVIAEIVPKGNAAEPITLNAIVSGRVAAAWPPIGWRFYGDKGTLAGDGFLEVEGIRRWTQPGQEPEPLATPRRLIDAVPHFESDDGALTMGRWASLVQDFVADIRGEPHASYLTFRDGWRYQLAIDAIRTGRGWQDLPTLT